MAAVGDALIIMVDRASSRSSAHTCHCRFTMAAKELCGQNIAFFYSFRSGGSFFVFLHKPLRLLECGIVYNAWDAVRHFGIFICVDADISFVCQDTANGVFIVDIAIACLDLIFIQIADNFCHCVSCNIHIKNALDHWGSFRVDLYLLVLNLKAQCQIAACGKAFFSVDIHSALDFLRKLNAVIFRHALQNRLHQDTTGVISDIFTRRKHLNAVFLKFSFVCCAVVSVSSKAVKLISQNALKLALCAIGNHALKLRAIIGGSTRNGTVNILAYNAVSVAFGILIAGFKLPLNRLLVL